jgi:hypothetical protein
MCDVETEARRRMTREDGLQVGDRATERLSDIHVLEHGSGTQGMKCLLLAPEVRMKDDIPVEREAGDHLDDDFGRVNADRCVQRKSLERTEWFSIELEELAKGQQERVANGRQLQESPPSERALSTALGQSSRSRSYEPVAMP